MRFSLNFLEHLYVLFSLVAARRWKPAGVGRSSTSQRSGLKTGCGSTPPTSAITGSPVLNLMQNTAPIGAVFIFNSNYIRLQHLHMPVDIFMIPANKTKIGQATMTNWSLNMPKACSKNSRPKSVTNPGTTLWWGQPHLGPMTFSSIDEINDH